MSRVSDVHEQKVPLLMEEAYRPSGWLGLLLGSRLYFVLDPEVLADRARYEATLNDVTQEVRRRAPLKASGLGEGQRNGQAAAASPAAVEEAASQPAPAREPARPAGAGPVREIGVVLNSHSASTRSTVHDNSSNFLNIGNSTTTIVLL